METIAYSLQNRRSNSQAYYKDVRAFTDVVITKANEKIIPIIDEYSEFLNVYDLEKVRAREEYLLELLSFGVLWHTYSQQALSVHIAPFLTLAKSAEWRKKHQRLKPLIDWARGIFISLFLLPEKSKRDFIAIPSLEQIDHVCKWFEATGEFREQAIRFILWRAFWQIQHTDKLNQTFSAINDFTLWFEQESLQVLGPYTQNVEDFLETASHSYLWREDRIQCTRSRLEYHLNMVGSELMNRAFRNDYIQTDAKVVLVPGCMRALPANKCKAVRVKEELLCQGCESTCRVNQLRAMGEKRDFKVFIIPHSSDLSRWAPREGRAARGVIASACVTTLVEGGWELKRYNVPAQCVLLDYCGCKKHWHKEG